MRNNRKSFKMFKCANTIVRRSAQQKSYETLLRMLCAGKLFQIFLVYSLSKLLLMTAANNSTNSDEEWSTDFSVNLINLLKQCERSENLTMHTLFGALTAEFLIKEHVRFMEPTRYEEQLFADLLQRFSNIIDKARNERALNSNLTADQRTILNNVFQRNVRLGAPKLKYGQIDTHMEFKSLIKDYEHLVNTGFPSAKLSDKCLAMIVGSRTCDISNACLEVLTSDSRTFGYQRTHQILLLYVFMHHKCAQLFGSPIAYKILARQRCAQVYREQNVLRRLDIPAVYRDLYLEQTVVCGLLGYAEFLNWHSVDLMSSWPHEGTCLCQSQSLDDNIVQQENCECTNHINSLALVYLTNAVLLLN